MTKLGVKRPFERAPIHPGEVLRADVLPALGFSISEASRRLGVSRQQLHRILACTHPITVEMALRIGRLVGNGPELWLKMQQAHDLWRIEQGLRSELEEITPTDTALPSGRQSTGMVQIQSEEYKAHTVFANLTRYVSFYQKLAESVFLWAGHGTSAIVNLDTYVYSSMQGTLDSIRVVLESGRLNDAYALLRKYYDSAVINIYVNVLLDEHLRVNYGIVDRIQAWLKGTRKLPKSREMVNYIRDSDRPKRITELLMADDLYRRILARCNDHTHYSFYRHVLLNEGERIQDRRRLFDQFDSDVEDLFILHLAYSFYLNYHYMMSSDYRDALECGVQPVDGSQYWVAPFVQEIFDDVVTIRRPEITAAIKECSAMQLA